MNIEELLIKEEGRVMSGGRHVAYQDHLGFWTIGFGCLIDERKGGGLTEKQALFLLRDEIAEKQSELDKGIPWWRTLSETRQTVLLAMAFQMGANGVLGFKNTLAKMRAGDYIGAANGIRKSLWASQTPARAERMAKAVESNEF